MLEFFRASPRARRVLWARAGLPVVVAGFLLPALRAQEAAPKPSQFLTVQRGTLPIILSAPHGGSRRLPDVPERQGVGVAKFVKARDERTAELAERLAAELERTLHGKPYLVPARFDRKYLDVNRPAESAFESDHARPYYRAYHDALTEACREVQRKWGRGLLLDIHGQAGYPDAVVRGTNDGKTVTLLRQRYGPAALTGPKSILGYLNHKGYDVLPRLDSQDGEPARYKGGYIVQTYGSHQGHGIDAIQLEFGTRYRRQKVVEQTARDLAEAITIFYREYVKDARP